MTKLKNTELNRISVEGYKELQKMPVVVVLDNVRSGYNVGSIFRTCDAFAVEKIFLCGITGYPPNKQVIKTSLGAEKSVEWEYSKSTVDTVVRLKNEGYIIASVEQTNDSVKLNDFIINPEKKYALIFGNEVTGVDEQIIAKSDLILEIPQWGTKHSLNISVSAGVVLWRFREVF